MKKLKRIAAFTLALALVVCVCLIPASAFAYESPKEAPYVLKQTFYGENALEAINNEDINSHFTKIKENDDLTVVAATVQTVYVIETISENACISESRLMTASEVAEYKKMRLVNNTLSTMGNTWIGDDGENHQGGKLSIYLVVYKDSGGSYLAYGTADWDSRSICNGGINEPDKGYDFIAITWGGDGELKLSDNSFYGEYNASKSKIIQSRARSDTYSGYCWQFNESYNYDFANYIDCFAKISKTYTAKRSRETNLRLTYIHTYQEVVGSISFQVSATGLAGGVTLSGCAKQWQIEIDVPGITY